MKYQKNYLEDFESHIQSKLEQFYNHTYNK